MPSSGCFGHLSTYGIYSNSKIKIKYIILKIIMRDRKITYFYISRKLGMLLYILEIKGN